MNRGTDTTKAKRAETYRAIAKEAEEFEARCDLTSSDRTKNGVDLFFTCTKVRNLMGAEESGKYAEAVLEGNYSVSMWFETNCMSIRVLALCFMAAMVEAGDA